MSNMSGRSQKKRGRSTVAPSPLVARKQRVAKSPASPGPKPSGHAHTLPANESRIVLDRLEKEIIPLFKSGDAKRRARVRRRLRMGTNEVTKFLENTAAKAIAIGDDDRQRCHKPLAHGSDSNCGGDDTGDKKKCISDRSSRGVVLICRDVRPARLVEHLHHLTAFTDTPRLVLPGSSSSAVGKLFGCKTMAALAICPAPPTRSDNAKETRMSSNKQAGCKVNSAAQVGKGRSEVHDSTSIEEDVTASLSDEVASASTMEKAIRGLSDVGETDGAAGLVHDRLAAVDEDVDSFIAFLCGKVSTQ